MPVIHAAEARRSETPTATMTTFASPTLGAAERPIWRVDVTGDAPAGPLHVINVEQVWVFLEGGAEVAIDGEKTTVRAGDTVVVPGEVERKFTADPETGFSAIVTAPAGVRAWPAPRDGEGIVPPWTV